MLETMPLPQPTFGRQARRHASLFRHATLQIILKILKSRAS